MPFFRIKGKGQDTIRRGRNFPHRKPTAIRLEEEEICNFEGFEEFFEESFEKQDASTALPQKGKEIHHRLRIGFGEAIRGTTARFSRRRDFLPGMSWTGV